MSDSSAPPTGWFRLNRPDVVFETFDAEAVVVHLRRGRYYSFSPEGTRLLEAIAAPAEGAELRLTELGEARRTQLGAFVAALLAEDLIVAIAPRATADGAVDLAGDAPPTFEIFTDLEDLLALDPIHDLETEGWPARPGTNGES